MGIDELAVDFLVLADRAEILVGKLYMMGGGWDRLHIQDFNQPALFSIAVGILVPWNRANEQHSVELQVHDADGSVVMPPTALGFVAGRPPIMRPGETQRVMMAINGAFKLPAPGSYVVTASIDGVESRRTVFYAHQAQGFPQNPPTQR